MLFVSNNIKSAYSDDIIIVKLIQILYPSKLPEKRGRLRPKVVPKDDSFF